MESPATASPQEELNDFYILNGPTVPENSSKSISNNNSRPYRLEQRFEQKLSLSESNHRDGSIKRAQAAEQKRKAFLEQKKGNLSKNYTLKVKKIAKEAKANRERKLYTLSKSMELAEFNRKQYIEQKRAKSKESVERAKYVALQHQLRSEQEQKRRKAELERRLKKTEERRLAHLNSRNKKKQPAPSTKSKRRTSSASSAFSSRLPPISVPPPKLITELMKVTNTSGACSAMMMTAFKNKKSSMTTPISAAAAAAVAAEAGSPNIKAKKKPSNWSIILKAFRELGLPSCSAPADTWPDFDHLQGLLREAKVIVVTTKVLNTALKITDENSRFRAKKLLMSYVILMCPEAALGDINKPEEKRVYESAKEMLRLFEVWLKAHGHPGATAARLAFVNAYNEYISVFDLWKSKDYSEFVQIMIKDYVQESTLRQTMLASEEQMATIETLDENLKTRKKQIERFAGKEGLEQLQRALEAALSSTSTGRKKQKELNTPRSPDFEQEYFTNQQQQEYHHATGREYMSLLLDQYISSAENVVRDGLANAQLAHELIMDPDFKIEKLTSAFENKVKTIAQKAFFDKMAEDIQNGQAHAVIPPLFSDIKNRLLVLSNPESSLYNNIQESIDILLIEQQLKQHPEQFDIQSVIDHILGLMAWMCAPVRDDEINEARSLRTLTSPHNNDKKGRITLLLKQLQTILSLLEKMTLDHANYKLHLLRPHLLSIAVDYERESFAAWLEQQHSSTSSSSSSASSSSSSLTPLGRTETWLTKSVDKLCQEAAKRNPDNIERSNKPSHDAILEDAFLSLLCQPILIAKDNVPETLALDVSRLAYFQNEIQAITIGGALVIIAKSFGSNIDDNSMFELASRLFTMLENNSSIEHLSAELIRVAHVKSEQRELLKNVVDKTLNYKDKVFTLVLDRVVKIIKSTIQSRKFVTSATLESFGLQYVQSQLQATALNIQRLVNHNRKVYATWYNQLIVKAVNDKLGTHEPQQQ